MIVKGLSGHLADRWLARYKGELDKEFETYRDKLEQKRKRLEAELSHRVYTTQTQFDTEFNAMKNIFAALGRLSFNGLRPMIDSLPEDQQERLRLIAGRLHQFTTRYNTLVDTAQSVYPFVPEDIYVELETCMSSALLEIRSIEHAGPEALSRDGYREAADHHDKFTNAYFKAAKLARERFNRMAVVA